MKNLTIKISEIAAYFTVFIVAYFILLSAIWGLFWSLLAGSINTNALNVAGGKAGLWGIVIALIYSIRLRNKVFFKAPSKKEGLLFFAKLVLELIPIIVFILILNVSVESGKQYNREKYRQHAISESNMAGNIQKHTSQTFTFEGSALTMSLPCVLVENNSLIPNPTEYEKSAAYVGAINDGIVGLIVCKYKSENIETYKKLLNQNPAALPKSIIEAHKKYPGRINYVGSFSKISINTSNSFKLSGYKIATSYKELPNNQNKYMDFVTFFDGEQTWTVVVNGNSNGKKLDSVFNSLVLQR